MIILGWFPEMIRPYRQIRVVFMNL